MKLYLLRFFPLIIITFTVIIIALLNYNPGTFITGGDNLHPEFNFGINIKRSIFSVWQEYQGLGLLGGMGHAADILRQLFLLPFSLILSMDQVRWFYTFFTLIVGSIGSYYLFLNLIKRIRNDKQINNQIIALIGALFYLLNLSTVQSYYTPFEVFTAHFASLPWLLLTTINYLTKPDKKNLLILSVVLIFATPAAYVPTLFVVYLIASFILGIFLIPRIKNFFTVFSKFAFIAFLINAFWLLPFLFFTITRVTTNVNAKINQMATETIYLNNREFGYLWDIALLRGFWFNNVEPNLKGEYVYMLAAWRDHINNPFILLLGFGIFLIIAVGIISLLKKRNRIGIAMIILFMFTITMLATATPPFSWINDAIRNYVPLFGQIFRFPFTKFSILTSLIYAFFFAYAIDYLLSKTKDRLWIRIASFILAVTALVIFTFPIFTGNLFYEREKVKIPDEYFKAFEYFEDQDPNTRIANFPQFTFWGWNFYNWGYSGSGFIWYGIEQPILDRAFDVWEGKNENYYWELNHALYSKNPILLKSTLKKYDVNFLLVDKNITSPSSPKSLFLVEFEELIKDIPEITIEKDYGTIQIYKFKSNDNNKFISNLKSLNSTNKYDWSNYDQSYLKYGDYYSNKDSNNTYHYPFRNLFTGRGQEDISFQVNETESSIEFISPLPESKNPVKLNIPSPATQNNTIPINLIAERNGNTVRVNYILQVPQIILKEGKNEKTVWENNVKEQLLVAPINENKLILNINGASEFEIPNLKENESKIFGSTTLTITDNNILVLSDDAGSVLDFLKISGNSIRQYHDQIESSISLPTIKNEAQLIVKVLKLNDKYSSYNINPVEQIETGKTKIVNCDNFRKNYFSYFIKESQEEKLLELASKNATPCISFYIQTLDHDQAYILNIENENINERGLHFWILNEDQKTAINDTYFEGNKKKNTSQIIIPPYEKYGKSYSIHFDNISIGDKSARNLLGEIRIDPIPFYFLTNLNIENPNTPTQDFKNISFGVEHPNQSIYLIKASEAPDNAAFALSQTYNPHWKAYLVSNLNILTRSFPFIFGDKIENHVQINNWKNGWIIEDANGKDSIVIVYLPQYLQYIGFALTTGAFIFIIYLNLRNKKHRRIH